MNRLDYYRDAVNRLNYAVKVMLTQFNGKYTELADPFWEVTYAKNEMNEKFYFLHKHDIRCPTSNSQ